MTRTQSREMRLGSLLYACVLFATGVGPVPRMHAQGLKVSSGDQLDRLTQRLRPGQAVFAPNIEPEGSIVIHIDLTRQVLTVFRNGVPIGVSTISSGRRGYGTPPRAPRSTPTGICGRTPTNPPGPPSVL